MLFDRRTPATWLEKIRISLWPRHSWARSFKYMSKRILRLTASPHAISAGVAAGVFASFTPFIGLHFLIAFAVAYLVAGNFLSAAMGTFFGNPLSFPFIWAATYKVGTFLLSGESGTDADEKMSTLTDADVWTLGFGGIWDLLIGVWEPVVKPMLVGAVPLGLVFGITAYFATRWATHFYQNTKEKRKLRKNSNVGKQV